MTTGQFSRGFQRVEQFVARNFTQTWTPYSRLFIPRANLAWVLHGEADELAGVAQRIGIRVAQERWLRWTTRQSVFYASRYDLLLDEARLHGPHRLGVAYFHGKPGTGEPVFDELYARLRAVHHRLERVHVSHSEMRDVVLGTGIAVEKVFQIPIGVNTELFGLRDADSRARVRAALGIPQTAVVVGSFQKDGNGWGEGDEAKVVKGPDVFLNAVGQLARRMPGLWVLLSGPSRGYVKRGLTERGIRYVHVAPEHRREVASLYHALDVYLVASRQEGGPKAVLEAMACGVPLVSTRVGQAVDLVRHGENGWLVDVEDADALAYWAEHIVRGDASLDSVRRAGRRTAEANSYRAQEPLWRKFMAGFVES